MKGLQSFQGRHLLGQLWLIWQPITSLGLDSQSQQRVTGRIISSCIQLALQRISPVRGVPIALHSKSRQWPEQAGRPSATLYRDDKSSEQSVTGHKPLPTIKPSPGNPFGGATVTSGGEGRRLLAQFTLTTLSAPKKGLKPENVGSEART